MARIIPAAGVFASAEPTILGLGHLVTALDGELIGKVTHLTQAKPGLWPLPAPFDEEDRFDNTREAAPLAAWALPANQREVQSFGPLVAEAVFGAKIMFLDAAADEAFLAQIATSPGHRLETGAWVTRAYQDLPQLPEVIQRIGWALIPIGPERSQGLFIVSAANAPWLSKLADWCDREGRNHGEFRLVNGSLALADEGAPEQFRRQAMAHQADQFLFGFETYFGEPEDNVLDLVRERLAARRALREKIARARAGGSTSTPG